MQDGTQPTYSLSKPVFFIGFMGAGKTNVSRFLARTCGLPYIDVDEYLEVLENRSIASIFREHGQDYFRDLETKYLKDIASLQPSFVSCGGGVVVREENIGIMKDVGYVVYLEVSAEEAAKRISNTDSRPLFKDVETARKTLEERRSLYENAADATVSTVGNPVEQVAGMVKALLEGEGVLIKAS